MRLALLALLAACTGPGKEGVDEDGDGVAAATDCDDGDPDVFPGADESCDGVDQDCDGEVDEDALDAATWYIDGDGDSYGAGDAVLACDAPDGGVADDTDCDDEAAAAYPGAVEVCDGLDNDCDSLVDSDDDDVTGESTWYLDGDDDGYGLDADTATACDQPAGYAAEGGDCLDDDAGISPGASEVCDDADVDEDCDGIGDGATAVDPTTWYLDSDGDGYGTADTTLSTCDQPSGYAAVADDCDDSSASFHPGATEDDCTDPADYNCDGSTGYDDLDADGWPACTECDDAEATVNPDATEVCNDVDDDCDGGIDVGAVDAGTWFADTDGDGWGDDTTSSVSCDAGTGTVAVGGDCDDSDATISPDAVEVCDDADTDEDCDGGADDADDAPTGTSTWYADSDGDTWGDDADPGYEACDADTSTDVTNDGDCDDAEPLVSPDGLEMCDGVDDDCDGTVDEDDAADAGAWYLDTDGDGFGDDSLSVTACEAPAGYVATGGDCDDTDALAFPGAPESCDDQDDDCDGAIDEDPVDPASWYADTDSDGYGNADAVTVACDAPTGSVADATDCDDTDPDVNLSGIEVCNGVDDDCEGSIDGDDAVDVATWYADTDADGYGDAAVPDLGCSAAAGFVADATDCDDARDDVHPGGTEACDDLDADEDCDGLVEDADPSVVNQDRWYADDDSDGYGDSADPGTLSCDSIPTEVANALDCDDGDPVVNPDGIEMCNGYDDDCDGSVDPATSFDASTWYADTDADGYGDRAVSTDACSAPTGYVATSTDCDDTDPGVSPADLEYCDGEDDDCDGTVDEASAVDATTWYRDADADNYGVSTTTTAACTLPSGYAALSTDCDDTDANVNPGEVEVCDAADTDEDCDALADDDDPSATGKSARWEDVDGDGYGDVAASAACELGVGYAWAGDDCDDDDDTVNPGATEVCDNGVDDNCDGDRGSCGLGGDTDLADLDLVLTSTTANDYIGSAVAGGDLDDDGYDDLLVAGYGYDRSSSALNAGRTWIFLGPLDGTETLATADATITGTSGGDRVGWSIAVVGDSDGDGGIEVAAGADGYNHGADTDAGAAYVFESPISGDSSSGTAPIATFVGDAASDYAGWAVQGGDFDGDGGADLLVGAYGNDDGGTTAGQAALWYGSFANNNTWAGADALFTGGAAGDALGYALDAADLDGDGLDDVVLGAYSEDSGGSAAGAVYVFTAFAADNDAGDADTVLTGAVAGDQLGHALTAGGDLDGDGLADLVVGALFYDATSSSAIGGAWMVTGDSAGIPSGTITAVDAAAIVGATTGDRAGDKLDAGGDVDGDGNDDLLVGAQYADDGSTTNAGAVYLLYGPLSGAYALGSADATWRGANQDAYAGSAMAVFGDTDADGKDDLVIGVQGTDAGSSNSVGAAYVVFGSGW